MLTTTCVARSGRDQRWGLAAKSADARGPPAGCGQLAHPNV